MGWQRSKRCLVLTCLMSALLSACPKSEIAVTQANDPATRAAMMAGVKIKTHPADQLFSDRITFSVEATSIDGSPLRYQWQISTDNGASYLDVSGAEEPSIVFEGLTNDAVGQRYRAQISTLKSGKKTTSNSAEIKPATETTSASINFQRHPEDQQTSNGDAIFNVKVIATGIADLAYQWQVSLNSGLSFSDIPGATTEILSLQNLTGISNGNLYRVKVSSSQKDIIKYSDEAILMTMSAVSIQTQPQSVTTATQTASFSVLATASLGDSVLYQWMRSTDEGMSFLDIPLENGASITLNGITTSNNGDRYMVRVEAGLGNTLPVYSESVILTIAPTISISSEPTNFTSTNGSASFSVSAASSLGELSYQWQKRTNGETAFTDIGSPTTTATLSLNGLDLNDHNTMYRAKISVNGTTSEELSNTATLSIKPTVNITSDPISKTISSLSTTFTVSASATLGGSLSYQWQKSTDGETYIDIGTNQASLSLTSLAPTTAVHFYHVIVSAGGLSDPVTSSAASLTISYTGEHDGKFYINSVMASSLDENGYGNYSGRRYSQYPTLYNGVDNGITYKDGLPVNEPYEGFCYTNGTPGADMRDPYLGVTGYCNDLYYYQGAKTHGMVAVSTSLLMHMNGDLADSSPIQNQASLRDNATFSSESPFSSNGSLFVPADGTNNALYFAAGPQFEFGSGDWTIEFWIKANGVPEDSGRVFQTTDGDNVTGMSIVGSSNRSMYDGSGECFLTAYFADGSSPGVWTQQLHIGSYDTYGWTHFVLTRSGSTITAYENGDIVGQLPGISFPLMPSSGNAVIGGNALESGARSINAYIDELRIVKGVALYNSAFTPPTTELSNIGLPHPKCFDHGEEVPGIDNTGTGVCLGKYYSGGVLSAGIYQDITYNSNGDPLTGLEFPDGRYFVDGQPAQGYHMAYDSRYWYSQSGYFIAGWYASSMMSDGVDSNGNGRWCEDKLTGSYQCNNYIFGVVFNHGYSDTLNTYFVSGFPTTLDSTGTGYWDTSMNWETYSYGGYYVDGTKNYTGWNSRTNTYYIEGQPQSGINSDGNGSCSRTSAMCNYDYYIGGQGTSLDSSGIGTWCGPDYRYQADGNYWQSSQGSTCHNYSNGEIIKGCTNSSATNQTPNATYDDGTCIFGFDGSGHNWSPWVYLGSTEVSSCAHIRSTASLSPGNMPWSDSIGSGQDGVYQIQFWGSSYNVYCDMTTDGGGWTLMAAAVGGNQPDSFWTTSAEGVNVGNASDLSQTSRLPDYLINNLKGNTGRYTKNAGSTAVFFNTSGLWFTSNSTSTVGTVCSDAAMSQSCRWLDYSNQNTGTWGIYDESEGGWNGPYTAILQPTETATECGEGPSFGVTGHPCDDQWPSSADTYLYLWGR